MMGAAAAERVPPAAGRVPATTEGVATAAVAVGAAAGTMGVAERVPAAAGRVPATTEGLVTAAVAVGAAAAAGTMVTCESELSEVEVARQNMPYSRREF